MLKFYTAGESHGESISGFLEGIPPGLKIDEKYITRELSRRRKGFGRSSRQEDEKDDFSRIGFSIWPGFRQSGSRGHMDTES